MSFTVFNENEVNYLEQHMFFGESVNVARYDQQTHPIFEQLTEKQTSFFWGPTEIDVSKDRADFNALPDNEKHIFTSNLKYQILLDSVQGRGPNLALLPIVSIPELETFIETWSFFETIHSRSYSHIIRNVFADPSEIFNNITNNGEITKRAADVSKYYDNLIEAIGLYQAYGSGVTEVDGKEVDHTLRTLKRLLYLALISINALEGIRFYASFACSFAFAERKKMTGNASIIKLIARDENVHLTATQAIINLMKDGKDDPEMAEIAKECESEAYDIYWSTAEQEMEWAKYLFKDGSMVGLNEEMLIGYVEFITNNRMNAIGLKPIFKGAKNTLPWMSHWLSSDSIQTAPQEESLTSYLIGSVEMSMDEDEFSDFEI